MRAGPPRRGAIALVLALLVGGSAVLADDLPLPSIDLSGPASGGRRAERQTPDYGDKLAVYDVAAVDADVVAAAHEIAAASGGLATTGRSGSIGMSRVLRDGEVVYTGPDGYVTPTIYVAFPAPVIGWVVGEQAGVAATRRTWGVGLNERTAALTGAQAGDTIELQTRTGAYRSVTVTAIVPDAELGGAELVMTSDLASRLNEVDDTRMVVWGFSDRDRIEDAIAASGLEERRNTGVRRSWDDFDPDSTIGMLSVKERLGEPWYLLYGASGVAMHPEWQAENLSPGRVLLSTAIPIRARCHVRVVDDLRAALEEVAAAGLGWTIDVANANTYGGCYNPRFSRDSWNLSRHAIGMALDTNTTTNCQGCRPQMNCDTVRIFRKHGFAWGGNFSRPDGMHFEWVGEPRDQIAYDSDYCSNIVSATAADGARVVAAEQLGQAVLIAGTEQGE